MEDQKLLSILNIIIGIVVISLSFIVIIFSAQTLATLITLLAIIFLFIGFARIINGFIDEKLTKLGKILKFFTGILGIVVGLLVIIITIINPTYSISILIDSFAIVLTIIGASRIFLGINIQSYPKSYRITMILGGTLTIVLGILIFVFPMIGYFILIVILSIALLINGIIRVSHGAITRK
ncbi:MAG: HdeD family acid-resistance protein [Candidatus Thorarchaeota archaeon]